MRLLSALLLLLLPLASQADLYLVHKGQSQWEEIKKLSDLEVGALLTVLRVDIGDPDDPVDPPTPPPTGLKGRVVAAARKANDSNNTISLRDLYATAIALADGGLPLLSVFDLLERGEAATLNTTAEKLAWKEYISVTGSVFKGSPKTLRQVRDIHSGLVEVASSKLSNAWINFLNTRTSKTGVQK